MLIQLIPLLEATAANAYGIINRPTLQYLGMVGGMNIKGCIIGWIKISINP